MNVALTQPKIHGHKAGRQLLSGPGEIQGSDYTKSEKIYENKADGA